jgi:hypothetical protein
VPKRSRSRNLDRHQRRHQWSALLKQEGAAIERERKRARLYTRALVFGYVCARAMAGAREEGREGGRERGTLEERRGRKDREGQTNFGSHGPWDGYPILCTVARKSCDAYS